MNGYLILVGGSLSDHWGRRRIFAIGVAVFALASVWSGLATSANQLILARIAQAIDESFVAGFRLAMFIGVGLALASALVAALMIEGKASDN